MHTVLEGDCTQNMSEVEALHTEIIMHVLVTFLQGLEGIWGTSCIWPICGVKS